MKAVHMQLAEAHLSASSDAAIGRYCAEYSSLHHLKCVHACSMRACPCYASISWLYWWPRGLAFGSGWSGAVGCGRLDSATYFGSAKVQCLEALLPQLKADGSNSHKHIIAHTRARTCMHTSTNTHAHAHARAHHVSRTHISENLQGTVCCCSRSGRA